MIIGTAGHIDHGKTALIKALTGIDGDRLKEEKARGITIDLGFAYLPIAGGKTLGFVDVPGHERFVHTMLAGASGIDLVLLVVAADDGIKPQTLEHLAIVGLLGIRRGLIALTKSDLVAPERLVEVTGQIRQMTAATPLASAEILPVSARTGRGIDTLRARLEMAASALGDHAALSRFRLAVDRVFTLAGIGVVVTGTVLSGTIQVGDRVKISPSGLSARVRSLHSQNRPADRGQAGDRCALNLAGDRIVKDTIHRGDVVLDPDLHAPTDRIDARLHLLPGETKPVRQWLPTRLHHAAAEVGAHIVLLGDQPIQPGETADVQLVLDRPIAAAVADRYVIRDVSAQRTLGGGQFIDLRPPQRKRRTPERCAQRVAQAIADPKAAFAALLATPPFAWDFAGFARDRALPVAVTDDIAATLRFVVLPAGEGQTALAPQRWAMLTSALLERLAAFHAENPDLQGIGRETLRLMSEPRLAPPEFAAALQKLAVSHQIVQDGGFVRLPSHTVQLAPKDLAAWQAMAPLMGGEARFRPPRVRDIASLTAMPERDVRRLLKLVGRLGWADEVAHDHFFLRETVNEMVAITADVAAHAKDGVFTAAQIRDRLDNGRKVAIQILEFLDRHGLTLKREDLRRVNRHRLDLFGPLVQGSKEMISDQNSGRESSLVGRSDFKSE